MQLKTNQQIPKACSNIFYIMDYAVFAPL